MTELERITLDMNRLEETIQREQAYIAKHGKSNDAGKYDSVWEQYKIDAQSNLDRWDELKKRRDGLKSTTTTGRKVFMQNNGTIFRTESAAKEHYGDRFESAISSNILHKFVVDSDDEVIGEW